MTGLPAGAVLLLVGTRKGTFLFWSDESRQRWQRSHHHLTSSVNAVSYDARDGSIYAATNSFENGAVVQRSRDGGASWQVTGAAPDFGDERQIDQIWQVTPGHPDRPGEIWIGTRQAGLFRSGDAGASWESVRGLNDHPTTATWSPGGGGLILHTIVLDPTDADRLYACVSTGGAYRTDDHGATWQPINRGVRADFLAETMPETGQCVHKLALHPAQPDTLYQQNHCGVYRSRDRGESWQEISAGLSSSFGFPIALHPHDPRTLFVVPLVSDSERVVPDGQMAIWRSRDAGDSWQGLTDGLPAKAWLAVLRESLATDCCEQAGVYVGTTNGQLFFSRDEGEHWECLADYLPTIVSVSAARVAA